jgi:Fungal specific transcription factor domain
MATRKDIKCEYSALRNAATLSRESKAELVYGLRGEPFDSPFPGSFFLDYDVYRDAQLWLPQINILLSPEVTGYVNDTEFIISLHFATTRSWMPILSKKKLYHELANNESQHQSDFIILLYCMKLLMWWPPGHDTQLNTDGRTAAYSTATQLLYEAEGAGILTLQFLQAKLFVCLYELGHGIYPAAYLSVGACARYGMALGIDDTSEAYNSNHTADPMDLEEMRRCWWVVIILDR